MSIAAYEAFVPPMVRQFQALDLILKKAEAFVLEGGAGEADLLTARLAPDMIPLTGQVQIASDNAKGGLARLAGREPPRWPDEEQSLRDLSARIERTIDYLKSVPEEALEGAEDRTIVLNLGGAALELSGRIYLFNFVLPNIYFHVTTAYGLLRHKGLSIGKRDFIGGLP